MKVKTITHCGIQTLRYRHDANEYLPFNFELLSEVSEPWQPEAQALAEELAEKRDCKIVYGVPFYSDDIAIYRADILVPKNMEAFNIITKDTRTGKTDLVEIILIESYDGDPYGDTVPRTLGSNQYLVSIETTLRRKP